jgi:hypothetical protein
MGYYYYCTQLSVSKIVIGTSESSTLKFELKN